MLSFKDDYLRSEWLETKSNTLGLPHRDWVLSVLRLNANQLL